MPEILIPYKDGFCSVEYSPIDEALIQQYKWHVHGRYVATTIKGKVTFLHRLILNITNPGILGDHINGDTFNNTRSNLRTATRSQNRRNSRKKAPASSKYKGTYFEKDRSLFHAQIGYGKRMFNLGRFRCELSSAKAYDRKALEIFGDYAHVNFESSREAKQLSWL